MKKTPIIFTGLFLLVCAHSFGQTGQRIFFDDFDNNDNRWDTYRDYKVAQVINNGSYLFEHRRKKGAWASSQRVALNPNADFLIAAEITKIYGNNNFGYGLTWGWQDAQNHYLFLVSGNGFFQISKRTNGKNQEIIPWTRSAAVYKRNARNKLVIKKEGNQMQFVVNGKLVAQKPYEPFRGERIGFFVYNQQRIKIDKIIVFGERKGAATASNKSNQPVYTHNTDRSTQSYPPDLLIENLKFVEPSGNKALDALEEGKIQFDLVNKGRGMANDIKVHLSPLQSSRNLKFEAEKKYERLPSKNKLLITIPIKANVEVQSLKRNFRIEVIEKHGFDSDPAIISFDTEKFKSPDLQIKQIAIDDNEDQPGQGDSYGNGNSIIEAGESIEVTAFVQNLGVGKAENVTAKVRLDSNNPHITFPDADKKINLGNIESGDYRKLEFYFYTSRRYKADKIPFSVEISEKHGKFGKHEDLDLQLGKRTPNIVDVHVSKVKATGKEVSVKEIEGIRQLSDVDKNIPETGMDGSNTLAIIIGIEDYKYAPNVEYAAHDAEAFYKYAKDIFGIPERNIYFRMDDGATSGEFNKIFVDDGWLARRIREGETDVIVYYAGHGAPDKKSKHAYLIPHDIDPNYASTGYSLDAIYESLSKLKARNITVFLDACFSGVSRSDEMLLAGTRAVKIKPKDPVMLADNMAVISAATGEQYGSGYSEKYHGLFTYYLLKALQGSAKGSDNQLTIQELFEFVRKNVSETAAYMDREQDPTLMGRSTSRTLIYY